MEMEQYQERLQLLGKLRQGSGLKQLNTGRPVVAGILFSKAPPSAGSHLVLWCV